MTGLGSIVVGTARPFRIGSPMSTRTLAALPPSAVICSCCTPAPSVSIVTVSFADQSAVVHVLGNAADRVAALLGFRAVRIHDAHAEIGAIGRQDVHQAVGADAEMAVAQLDGKARRALRKLTLPATTIKSFPRPCIFTNSTDFALPWLPAISPYPRTMLSAYPAARAKSIDPSVDCLHLSECSRHGPGKHARLRVSIRTRRDADRRM